MGDSREAVREAVRQELAANPGGVLARDLRKLRRYELEDAARAKGVRGVSRMSKAALANCIAQVPADSRVPIFEFYDFTCCNVYTATPASVAKLFAAAREDGCGGHPISLDPETEVSRVWCELEAAGELVAVEGEYNYSDFSTGAVLVVGPSA
jgi:hypothetical protein